MIATAILDRLLHHSHIVNIRGESPGGMRIMLNTIHTILAEAKCLTDHYSGYRSVADVQADIRTYQARQSDPDAATRAFKRLYRWCHIGLQKIVATSVRGGRPHSYESPEQRQDVERIVLAAFAVVLDHPVLLHEYPTLSDLRCLILTATRRVAQRQMEKALAQPPERRSSQAILTLAIYHKRNRQYIYSVVEETQMLLVMGIVGAWLNTRWCVVLLYAIGALLWTISHRWFPIRRELRDLRLWLELLLSVSAVVALIQFSQRMLSGAVEPGELLPAVGDDVKRYGHCRGEHARYAGGPPGPSAQGDCQADGGEDDAE